MNGGYATTSLNRDVFSPEGDPINIDGIFKSVENAFNNDKPIFLDKYTVGDNIYGASFVTTVKIISANTYYYELHNDIHYFKVYNNNDVEIYNVNEEEEE